MTWLGWGILLAAAAAPPRVEMLTLDGQSAAGAVQSLTERQLELATDAGVTTTPLSALQEVRVLSAAPAPDNPADSGISVRLVDGSRLQVRSLSVQGNAVAAEHAQLGALQLPLASVRSLRFVAEAAPVEAAWKQLLERPSRQDLLIVRKGDVLDHLDGVAGRIDEQTVQFRLDGEDVSVKRERVFGIVYARKAVEAPAAGARADLVNGDQLFVRSVVWSDDQWRLTLPGDKAVTLPADALRTIDFSLGKIVYLSALEPREVKHTPFFNFEWDYQRNRSLVGRPLMIGSRVFQRGLAIHSRTLLRYRLGGEYRRFTATLGPDPDLDYGTARLVISGDGKPLLETDVDARQPPRPIDLPVEGVVELSILVDFGRDQLDNGDRVHLGDAKVVK